LLGERGQAKTRMIRSLVELLDEWLPIIEGSEVRDNPFAPISAYGIDLVAQKGRADPGRLGASHAPLRREARLTRHLDG